MVDNVANQLIIRQGYNWQLSIDKENSNGGNGRNKLRTYRNIKRFYEPEQYCSVNMPISHRTALAKFRCGVAPLKIETGRYSNQPMEERFCPFCLNVVENEVHAILHCPEYETERNSLFRKANEYDNTFSRLSDSDKFIFLFSTNEIVRDVAKTCFLILKNRSSKLYK